MPPHLNHHRYTAAFEKDQLTFNLVTYAMSPPLPPPLQVPALRCNPPTITLWLIRLHYWEDTATGPAHQAIKLKQFSNINMVINWRGGRLSDWLWQGGQAGVVFCRLVTVWWHVMQAPPVHCSSPPARHMPGHALWVSSWGFLVSKYVKKRKDEDHSAWTGPWFGIVRANKSLLSVSFVNPIWCLNRYHLNFSI